MKNNSIQLYFNPLSVILFVYISTSVSYKFLSKQCLFVTDYWKLNSLTGVHSHRDGATIPFLRLSDPIVSLVFSLLSWGKCDKVPLSLPVSMFDCLFSRLVGLLLLQGDFGRRRLFYARLQEGQIQNQ